MPRDEYLYGPKQAEKNKAQFSYVTAKLVEDGGHEFQGGWSYMMTDTFDQTKAPGEMKLNLEIIKPFRNTSIHRIDRKQWIEPT